MVLILPTYIPFIFFNKMIRLLLSTLVTLAAAAPCHVIFIVDGAPSWGSLIAQLPPPDYRTNLVPTLVATRDGSMQPESASAASELSTGCPGVRRAVSPSGQPLGARAISTGAAAGAVSDACVTDPTVASFFVSSTDRYKVREGTCTPCVKFLQAAPH